MKTKHITFTEGEYKKIFKAKRTLEYKQNTKFTWTKFLLVMATKGISVKRDEDKKNRGILQSLKTKHN